MKPQDAVFFLTLLVLLITRQPRLFIIAGLSCLVLSIPLFATWVFFTAERLTWYAAAFIVVYILISTLKPRTVQ